MTLANSADLSDEIPNKFPLGLKVGIAQMRSGLCEVCTVCTCESQDGLVPRIIFPGNTLYDGDSSGDVLFL